MNILKTALEAIELLTTDNASEQAQAAAADARIKLMNAMTHVPEADFGNISEPVAWMIYVAEVQNQYVVDDIDDAQLVDDCTNHGAEVTPLYLHPPQPYDQQAMELCSECGWKAIMPGEPCFVCNMNLDAQQAKPMTDEAAKNILENSSLLDMFENIGWYSAPRNGFNKHALSLIRDIEQHHRITAQGEKP